MLIDATGNYGDYVTIAMGSILHMFRQYTIPYLIFEDSYADFSFNVTFSNDVHEKEKFLTSSEVMISNSPEKITIFNEKLKDKDFLTSQVNYENKYQ